MILSTGGLALSQGGAWSGGGLLPRGCLVETPSGTANAAGGTNPTGMHSCFQNVFNLCNIAEKSCHHIAMSVVLYL